MIVLILTTLWQIPQSLGGLFFLVFGRVRIHDATGAVFMVAQPGGLGAWWLGVEDPLGNGSGSWAITFGPFILCASKEGVEHTNTRAHEGRHVQQGNWFGPLFMLAYGVAAVIALLKGKLPLRDNWFEQDADAAGRRAESLARR